MVTLHAYEMAIRAVKKHKGVDISYPRAVMAVWAVFDLILFISNLYLKKFKQFCIGELLITT